MAIRDAGDFGFGLSFEDAVRKGRAERWSDRDIAALLGKTEEEVKRVAVDVERINLAELAFRPDAEGGTVIEYLVDGRKKTQAIPLMLGRVLEAVVKEMVEMKGKWADFNRIAEAERERLSKSDGQGTAGRRAKPGRGSAKKKANAKAWVGDAAGAGDRRDRGVVQD